ncbi:anthranilate phosphoribosyltransferase [Tuwongella immobilis]|uniref:anthranilate phosphoribosyltransferase n=1 Tax=Tuwongella immobilis TaxID=692036 RepID=UPI0013A6AE06|nr:anthranilate phosphoribosyltransferase [Tuwongella immobilis]
MSDAVSSTPSMWFRACYPVLMERLELPDSLLEPAVEALIAGEFIPLEAAAFLTALRLKGETVQELATTARVLRKHMQRLKLPSSAVIDTCGTGGDGSHTFNISTAVSIVVAAAGVPVVKHGNRSVSSRSGSADVLRALGVPIEAGVSWSQRCLTELGYAFCYAPHFHPGMANIASVRRHLGVRTVFNLVGPLANPAEAPYQLMGVGRLELLDTLAGAMAYFRPKRAALVAALDGLDEVSLSAPTRVRWIEGGMIRKMEWTAADFGLPESSLESIRVDSPEVSAMIIQAILDGAEGPATDVTLANASAALWVAGKVGQLSDGVGMAQEAIRSGKANALLQRLTRSAQ